MFGISGPWEWVIILVIIAMFFGVGRLPEVFGSVGKGIREFRELGSYLRKFVPAKYGRNSHLQNFIFTEIVYFQFFQFANAHSRNKFIF